MSSIRYRISAPKPGTHLFHIEATILGVGDDATLDFHLPVWTPGSYLVREYAQHVQRLTVRGDDGGKRMAKKLTKSTWQIDCRDTNSLELSYDVFAHDLGVRNNHLDATHGFLTPSATLMWPEGRFNQAVEVEIVPPDGWAVWCGLPTKPNTTSLRVAQDFDELYDAPIEMGPHHAFSFEALGVPHEVVFWGEGNHDPNLLVRDLPKIVEANAEIFGGEVPYNRYLTIVLLTDKKYGGLEHRNSTALMWDRHEFRSNEGELEPPITDKNYRDFLTLFAHEHFHVWHVKRIRPERLGPFDYLNENYTRDIWTIEGITSYYQEVSVLRAGLMTPAVFLERFADAIKLMETVPGRELHSLEDSSFDTWVKLYRPHENNRNSTVSYYLKGKIISALLDVNIRTETMGEFSLDDVMRELWKSYSQDVGYPEGGLESIIEDVAGIEIWEFFDTFVRGTDDPDYNDLLEGIGLKLDRTHKDGPKAWIGVDFESTGGRLTVKSVRADGPAIESLDVADEIVAVDGFAVNKETVGERLRDIGIGGTAKFHVIREGLLRETEVRVEQSPPDTYKISMRENLPQEVTDVLSNWLGGLPEESK